jgi:hypothetical protein
MAAKIATLEKENLELQEALNHCDSYRKQYIDHIRKLRDVDLKRLELIESEASLSQAEKDIVEQFQPPDGETKTEMWGFLSDRIFNFLKEQYLSGEISLDEALLAMRMFSLGLPNDKRILIIGLITEFCFKNKPVEIKREPGQKKTNNWRKRLIVQFFKTVAEKYPDLNKFSEDNRNNSEITVAQLVLNYLTPLQLEFIASEKSLQRWLTEDKKATS